MYSLYSTYTGTVYTSYTVGGRRDNKKSIRCQVPDRHKTSFAPLVWFPGEVEAAEIVEAAEVVEAASLA